MTGDTYSSQMDAPVDRPPQRVVSLVPSVTESLFDLALGDRLIAITDYCVYPVDGVAHLPRIGGTKNPDVARVIEMRPDLVIANQEENHKEDVEALRAAGIPVWVTFPRTVADTFNLLWNIMDVFDAPAMVPRIRLIEQTMDWVWRISEKRVEDQECRVFAPIWLDPLMTFNGDTYASDLLRVCGAVNVFANRERQYPLQADLGNAQPMKTDDARLVGRDVRYPRVSLEEVVSMQPDVVLLPSEPFQFTTEHIQLFSELDIPAAKNKRIMLVDGSLLTWHGTRIAYALNALPDYSIRSEKCSQMTKSDASNEWLDTVAHDLRTPINLVYGCLDVIQSVGPLNEKQLHYLNRAFAGLKRMEHLIARLKDISWVDSTASLELSEISFPDLVAEAVDLLLEAAEQRDVKVQVNISPDIQTIRVDAARMAQVMDNLLSNAIKYNRQGGTVFISASQEAESMLVMVQDSGIGITEEDQTHVFDRFFRSQEGVRLKIEGSGLGLAITRGIIQRHGGKIWVESQSNVGSTFYFTLPFLTDNEISIE